MASRAVCLFALSLPFLPSVLTALDRTSGADLDRAPLPTLVLTRAETPPVIDGNLDDVAWLESSLSLGEWEVMIPTPGEKMDHRTEVWAAYDDEAIYFAFLAHDPEPEKVRTRLSRRDQIYEDDNVGVAIDAANSAQLAYEMYVNPSGIQLDIVTTNSTGSTSDPDWLWDSAGRMVPEGYAVEIRLPLTSIRFEAGDEVKMGMIFWRGVSRLGQMGSWPPFPAGRSQFECQHPVVLRDVSPPRTVELIPSVTYGWSRSRVSRSAFGEAQSDPDAGLSAKLGITPSVTADLTVNPDFSQVESDAFQVEVNQRYPTFYSEKRPFFMEGLGIFALAGGGGDSNLRTAVHTRQIVNPLWGGKLTGSLGNLSFATLHAADRLPETDQALDSQRYYNVGRALFSLGERGYTGALLTSTANGRDVNHVAAFDVALRGRGHSFNAALMGSYGRGLAGPGESGLAGQADYRFRNRRVNLQAGGEHFDRSFRMDTAFMNQTGLSRGWGYASLSAYPQVGWAPGLRSVSPYVYGEAGRDREQGGDRRFLSLGVRLNFTRQGRLSIDGSVGQQPWAQQEFDTRRVRVRGEVQATSWLRLDGHSQIERSVYYDPDDPFPGTLAFHRYGISLQPTHSLNLSATLQRSAFDQADTGERIYTVNLLNTRATYQFDDRFALRAIVQYDSYNRQVLTDLLASYELRPGTVAFLGYGSLYERREWEDETARVVMPEYLVVQRGLFFKLSYAHRF